MYNPRSFAVPGIASHGLAFACLLLVGCEKSDQITTYSVPKHESLQTPAFTALDKQAHPKPHRMIAVTVPQPEFLWFFKLEGEPTAVASREKDLQAFIATLRFPSTDEVDWTLPGGWKKLPGNDMRYATLVLDGEPTLELSVTKLPTHPNVPIEEQVVMNVNRWRGQLTLPSIEKGDLGFNSEKTSMNGFIAYWINIVGNPRPRPVAMPKLLRQEMPAGHKPESVAPTSESGKPTYVKPEGWTEAKSNGIAVVSLQVRDGESKVGITVTSAGGSRLSNVNRWRGQLNLGPIDDAELEKLATKVDVGRSKGELFEIKNDATAIFGVIFENRDKMWFVKMTGNIALAERERGRFGAFLESLQLND